MRRVAHAVTPILNVSDILASFAWFAKLGWTKGFDWGTPPTFGSVCSGKCEIFLCQGAQGGRGKSSLPTTKGHGEAGDKGVWMSIWVDDVDAVHRHCLDQGIEVTMPADRRAVERPGDAHPPSGRARLPDQQGDRGGGVGIHSWRRRGPPLLEEAPAPRVRDSRLVRRRGPSPACSGSPGVESNAARQPHTNNSARAPAASFAFDPAQPMRRAAMSA